MRGALFETGVVTEFIKHRWNHVRSEGIYFWRYHAGQEIDLVVERRMEDLWGIECKSGVTVASDWVVAMQKTKKMAKIQQGSLVYGGDADQPRAEITVFGWKNLTECM